MKKTITSLFLVFALFISSSHGSHVEAATNSKAIGTFKIYAYSKQQHGTRTFSGKKAVAWKTIAADPKVLPMGTIVKISGLKGEFVVMDKGGSIKGKKLDIFVNTNKEARKWGVRNRKITVIKWGKRK